MSISKLLRQRNSCHLTMSTMPSFWYKPKAILLKPSMITKKLLKWTAANGRFMRMLTNWNGPAKTIVVP